MREHPLIGYCDICGTVTAVDGSPNVSSDNRMHVYDVTIHGQKRRLCDMHIHQEKMNQSDMDSKIKPAYKDKFEAAFRFIFPNQRIKPQ